MGDEDARLDILRDEGEANPEGPRRGVKRRSRWWLVLVVFGVLVALIAGLLGFYLVALNNALSNIKREPDYAPPSYAGRPAQSVAGPINVLLLGSDSRGAGDTGRSDAIMWVHVSGDRKNIYITSFTRDLWVNIPGYHEGKINWGLAFGGVPLQVRTVETVVGARVDHVASIDFDGFIKLTDLLGGVNVYNKYASKIDQYAFPQGDITISGEQALAYVRERYDLPAGAWSRAERQRDVVAAIIMKMIRPEVLANPAMFGDLANGVSKTVTVDEGVTNKLIYDTALSLKLDGKQAIHSLQAPVASSGMVGDQYVDHPNVEQLKELGAALSGDTMASYVAKYPT